MHFASPLAFLLFLLLPVLYYFSHFRSRRGALRFSAVAATVGAGTSFRQRCEVILPIARFAALALLIIALARPQEGQERVRDQSQGIAIEVVIDRSSSMSEQMSFDGQVLNRLDVVKRVFDEFVHGNGDTLGGRPNDLIGLISFAGFADTIAPLTLGHDALSELVEKVELVQLKSEDGTAIGDALALAAARLKTAEETQIRLNATLDSGYEIKSKIIILLTDGQSNRGEIQPAEAARMAKDWNIKLYTIGIGGDPADSRVQTSFGSLLMPQRRDLDEESLQALADITGGVYRRAGSARALREIYEEIDQLETSEIESVRYLDYKERFMLFALAGLTLLLGESILQNTWLRRLP